MDNCSIRLHTHQDSTNNSTSPSYSKKTQWLGNFCVWTYEKGPRVIRLDLVEYQYFRQILQIFAESCRVEPNYSCFWPFMGHSPIFDLIFNSRSSNSASIHQFYYLASTWLRSLTFSIRLDDESRVGTPLRRYLTHTFLWLAIII